ncbi:hypothetical protein VZT92_003436 [Zoarces viviparus]|uniref:Uncharacterized protein n=1 Tax=Zoarces viviparus TaxID=48416 RepID=A0AAW1FYA2_ZOAVI
MLTRNVLLLFSLFILLVEADLDSNEDESSNSKEGGNKKFSSRSAKPQSSALPPQRPAHIIINHSPALPSQPIIPQLKALVGNHKPKRRSRTNRRQI